MSGTSTSSQQTQQSGTTAPWQPTQGILKDILGGISGQFGNYMPNATEQSALGMLGQNAQNMPNYGAQAQGLASDMLSGGQDNTGLMRDAYSNYQRQLNPIANQNNDPMQTPGMQSVLDTIRGDVGNSVNGMFAGAGRDMSGMNQQTLARGIAQGEAAPLLGQYNQNVQNQLGAAGSLYGAGMGTAQGLQGLQQTQFGNRAAGLDLGMNGVPQAMNGRANAMLDAQARARNLPLQNLGSILGLTLPIAGMGSQTTGQSTTQGSQTMSPWQQAMQGIWGANTLFSDRRLKTDIEHIGTTVHNLPLYEYTIFGERQRGVMADEVQEVMPDAVVMHPSGYLMVDYQKLGFS